MAAPCQQSVGNMSDDDFFVDNDSDTELDRRSYDILTSNIKKDGYRTGRSDGEDESVQTAFNESFSLSSSLLYQIAQIRGKAGGLLMLQFLQLTSITDSQQKQLHSLMQDIVAMETQFLSLPSNPAGSLELYLKNISKYSKLFSSPKIERGLSTAKEELTGQASSTVTSIAEDKPPTADKSPTVENATSIVVGESMSKSCEKSSGTAFSESDVKNCCSQTKKVGNICYGNRSENCGGTGKNTSLCVKEIASCETDIPSEENEQTNFSEQTEVKDLGDKPVGGSVQEQIEELLRSFSHLQTLASDLKPGQ